MISRELEVVFNLALKEAETRRHDLVSVEHLFFALLHDPYAREIIENCGGSIESLRGKAVQALDSLPMVPDEMEYDIEQTQGCLGFCSVQPFMCSPQVRRRWMQAMCLQQSSKSLSLGLPIF